MVTLKQMAIIRLMVLMLTTRMRGDEYGHDVKGKLNNDDETTDGRLSLARILRPSCFHSRSAKAG